MISAFPKIFSIGTGYIRDLFNEEVEVTEKVDGSQFVFGKVGGNLYLRSKGAELFTTNPEKMFAEAISYIDSIQDRIPEGMIYYSEYLKNPKHNTLTYSRVPKNHLILFGVKDVSHKFYTNINAHAEMLGIETIPVIHTGKINDPQDIFGLIDRESVLGGAKVEGVVVKNYHRQFLLGGQPMPLMAGKYVSESFKEVHRDRWGKEETGSSRIEVFMQSFRTEARWEKAVQHLTEKGELVNEPKDIGVLFKEIHNDIQEEEKENIKNFLWQEYKDQIKRTACAGFPEWYKKRLVERNFN